MTDELCHNEAGVGVHLERDYDGTPEELWECWTDPVRLQRWLGTPARPPLPAGGPVRLIMGDGEDQWVDVRVLAADRPRLLRLAWDFPGQSGTELTVEFVALTQDRTRVVLRHDGLGESATGYGAGWQAYLEGGLRRETGDQVESAWADRFGTALPAWRERSASGRSR